MKFIKSPKVVTCEGFEISTEEFTGKFVMVPLSLKYGRFVEKFTKKLYYIEEGGDFYEFCVWASEGIEGGK